MPHRGSSARSRVCRAGAKLAPRAFGDMRSCSGYLGPIEREDSTGKTIGDALPASAIRREIRTVVILKGETDLVAASLICRAAGPRRFAQSCTHGRN